MPRFHRLRNAWLLLCLGFAACASSGGGADTDAPLRVTLRNYRGDQFFELVSEVHTDRVRYYSTPRDSASRKIVDGEVVSALIEELDARGFRKRSKAGRAPSQGGSLLTWGLEVDRGGPVQHWIVGQGTPAEDVLAFQQGMQVFLELYNNVVSFQTIENPDGRQFFENERARSASQPPGSSPR